MDIQPEEIQSPLPYCQQCAQFFAKAHHAMRHLYDHLEREEYKEKERIVFRNIKICDLCKERQKKQLIGTNQKHWEWQTYHQNMQKYNPYRQFPTMQSSYNGFMAYVMIIIFVVIIIQKFWLGPASKTTDLEAYQPSQPQCELIHPLNLLFACFRSNETNPIETRLLVHLSTKSIEIAKESYHKAARLIVKHFLRDMDSNALTIQNKEIVQKEIESFFDSTAMDSIHNFEVKGKKMERYWM